MPTGTLTYFNHDRGFGFLGRKPDGPFVHLSAFVKAGLELIEGQQYTFRLATSPDNRVRAVDIALDDGFLEV